MHVQQMIATHPEVQGNTADHLLHCIEECYDCASVCTSCADVCLAEGMVEQTRQCIRLNFNCADVCAATGWDASRRKKANVWLIRTTVEACGLACLACEEEGQKHTSMHEHCHFCAQACRNTLADLHRPCQG